MKDVTFQLLNWNILFSFLFLSVIVVFYKNILKYIYIKAIFILFFYQDVKIIKIIEKYKKI